MSDTLNYLRKELAIKQHSLNMSVQARDNWEKTVKAQQEDVDNLKKSLAISGDKKAEE